MYFDSIYVTIQAEEWPKHVAGNYYVYNILVCS
jgi:hypothetical protein